MGKRVACYARTSTLDQATGLYAQVREEAIKEGDTLQLRVGSSRYIEVLSKSLSELEMPRWLGSVPAFPF